MLPLVSYGEYADGTDRRTDGRTPDRYITLSPRRGENEVTVMLITSYSIRVNVCVEFVVTSKFNLEVVVLDTPLEVSIITCAAW